MKYRGTISWLVYQEVVVEAADEDTARRMIASGDYLQRQIWDGDWVDLVDIAEDNEEQD
jgi:hypothetical protein